MIEDADILLEDGCYHLAYLGFDQSEGAPDATLEEATLIVGQIALETLRRHGVKAEWDITVGRRIGIDLTCKDLV